MYEQWAGRCAETFERISRQKGFNLLGYFHCQGAPSPPIEEFIHNEIMFRSLRVVMFRKGNELSGKRDCP